MYATPVLCMKRLSLGRKWLGLLFVSRIMWLRVEPTLRKRTGNRQDNCYASPNMTLTGHRYDLESTNPYLSSQNSN